MDIYQALVDDHDQIKDILDQLCNLREDDDFRVTLVNQLRDILIPHARAEEAVFYNTLRALDADKSLKGHGYTEHAAAETPLRTLQGLDKMDKGWKKTAEMLRDALNMHITHEESSIFSEARSVLSQQEADSICQAFMSMKPKIQEQGMMKNTMEMVINMMPPRFSEKLRNMGGGEARS